MRILALTLTLLSTSYLSQAADLKVGVVDVLKCVTDFYKTKDAEAKIKGNREKSNTELNERYASMRTLMSTMTKLQQTLNDPVLGADAKAKAQAELQSKSKEGRALEQEITEFQQRRALQLRQEEAQFRKALTDEVMDVIKKHSKDQGFDFVFDRSGQTAAGVPALLYFKDATDFSDEIIVELNKAAPAPGAAPAADKPAADAAKTK